MVFLSDLNTPLWQKTGHLIPGPVSDSYFGYAIQNIGDVNNDGYDDIAVGAPYDHSDEKTFSDTGAVHIFNGAADNKGLAHSQKITAEEIRANSESNDPIKGFGFSLASHGIDKDFKNPDLAIGTLSDKIVMLKTRPAVKVGTSKGTNILKNIDFKTITQRDMENQKICFAAEVSPILESQRFDENKHFFSHEYLLK